MAANAAQIEDLAHQWETMGIEDQTLEVERTMTMRPPTRLLDMDRGPRDSQLPRLVGDNLRGTMPELEFKGKLGEGGMGLVHLADQVPLGRDVAVKALKPTARKDETRLALLREGWTTGLLEHPNIVPVYTLGRDGDDEPIIVMKRIGGVSWLELLRDPSKAPREFDSEKPLDWHIDILAQVCNAVHYAHSKGIIHRDLKPENVMIGEFGEVYVLDWGIAVSLTAEPDGRLPSVADISSPAGTPAYMAPEMVRGEGDELSVRTDVYLLGALLHEILTGRPPHGGETLYQIMFAAFNSQPHDYDETVPGPLADICHRAMAADPAERYESVEQLRQALVDYKRHREALDLSEQAEKRLAVLQEMLDDSGSGPDSEAEIYKIFGECRFGFEQALRVEPSNETARDGQQSVLELMAHRELERGAYQAASLLIADFPEPAPDFERRLEELGRRLDSREQEFEVLRKIQREADPEVGRSSRSILMLALGLIWGATSMGAGLGVDIFEVDVTHEMVMGHAIFLNGVVGAASYAGRRWLFQNELNRRIMYSLLAFFAGSIVFRTIIWLTQIEPFSGLALEFFYYGMCGSIIALTLDRRILWGAVPYIFIGPVVAIFPEFLLYIFGVTNVVAMSLLAWAWWPRRLTNC